MLHTFRCCERGRVRECAMTVMLSRITSLDACKENLAECSLLDRRCNQAVADFSSIFLP